MESGKKKKREMKSGTPAFNAGGLGLILVGELRSQVLDSRANK